MSKVQSVTDLQHSPELERRKRMLGYLIAMTVRVACIIAGVLIDHWIRWILFAGAIFLPYFAVVFANAVGESSAKSSKKVQVQTPALKVAGDDFKVVNLND